MSRRIRGVNLRSRLLCPVCSNVIQVATIEDEVITLECGHQRGELLPSAPNCLSLESLRTKAGQRAFPANREGEQTTLPEWSDWVDPRWR